MIPEVHKQTAASDQVTLIQFKKVTLEVPAGALNEPVEIIIEELTDLNKLNPGMLNVTGGAFGYRFKPDGLKFTKEVRVTIPYDKTSIDEEIEYANLYTFFYNEQTHIWERLPSSVCL
jgi:hypothetical protein